jgi:hypothetical protein
MIEFLRPSTRVYIGPDYETPAVITQVGIRGCGCPVYTVDWWEDGSLHSQYMERFQFSVVQETADRDHGVIETEIE